MTKYLSVRLVILSVHLLPGNIFFFFFLFCCSCCVVVWRSREVRWKGGWGGAEEYISAISNTTRHPQAQVNKSKTRISWHRTCLCLLQLLQHCNTHCQKIHKVYSKINSNQMLELAEIPLKGHKIASGSSLNNSYFLLSLGSTFSYMRREVKGISFGGIYNMELTDLRIIICLRKSEVSVERISVCNVTENLAEHGRHCLPCSYTNDVINM